MALGIGGCSRAKYRLQADYDAYDLISERNADTRWHANDYHIDLDPRSRFFDAYDPDRSPMPADDPASHQYMHVVDGMKGWKHWHDNGERLDLENPGWRESLAEYTNVEDDGDLKLDLDTAVRLAYVHSPAHQNQLETLYLSALDVSAERFRLDTQFFGGYDARYAHNGSLIPPALRFDPVLGRFVINPAIDGVENNRLTLGRPFGASPVFSMERRFATAGELLVGFANSFVFEFTGGDANLSTSLANFSLIQPLLRGAGKDVALEQLTFVERALLSNLRSYSQYRQGFYTQVAIGELGVTGPQRSGASTVLQSFGGSGFVGGYIGLLEQLQQIRNSEDNLSLQLRTLERLEAFLDVGLIDLVQVEQFRQSVEDQRANLLLNRNAFELELDRYKTDTLGLPPDQGIVLNDGLIRQFQLIPRKATAVQNSIVQLQDLVGNLPDDVEIASVQGVVQNLRTILEPVKQQLGDTRADLSRMNQSAPAREETMTPVELEAFKQDRAKLEGTLHDLNTRLVAAETSLIVLQEELPRQPRSTTTRRLVVWLNNLSRIVERSILVQARARLEAVSIDAVELKSLDAFQIALANRLDFMNGRAALVDSWRLIQFNADALQSVVNVTAGGEIRTARNNPFSFRAPTGSLRLGLEVDAPYTRLLERNAYRESLIDYQRNRRQFIQSRDSLHLGLRALLRQAQQLRTNLEIQRRAVAIAIRRVDLTQAELAAPQVPPLPGQRGAQFGPTAAIQLLAALSALRTTQDNFLSVWLSYYATQMRLSRELGVMTLDEQGRWIKRTLPASVEFAPETGVPTGDEELPPTLPTQWINQPGNAEQSQQDTFFEKLPSGTSTTLPGSDKRRLPIPPASPDTDGYIPAESEPALTSGLTEKNVN